MTHVCFVSLNAYKVFDPHSSANIGGTELQMHAIATELAKNPEYRVSFIVGDFDQEAIQKMGNITVYASFPLQKVASNLMRAPFILWRVLRRIRPDVIISSPAGPEVGLLALYAKITGKRYIFRTASDVDCTKKKERDMGSISGTLYRIGIRLSDTVITQHEGQRKDLQKYYSKDSLVIANGYQIPSPTDTQRKKEKIIMWIGSSRTVKRPDIFFQTAEHFPHYQFCMILSHSGDKDIYTSSEEQAKKLPNVTFLGELAPEETNTRLEQSHILLGTSDYEGSPNTYIAAMLRNVAIVSLNVPCEGIQANGSIEKMYEGIKRLMEDDAQHTNISVSGNSYARAHHDMQRVIQDWISVIRTTRYSG